MAEKPEINVGDLRKSGVVKLKGNDMYSVWVKTACCNLNSKQLRNLADITDKYATGYLLFTTRQIPIIPFVNLKDVEEVKEELKQVYLELDRCGPTVRNINVCYDDKICLEAITNSISLAEKLDTFFRVPSANHKIKIGVAGCQKDCIICRVLNDIGFVARESNGRKGYDAYLGGRLGVKPFLGVKMAKGLSEEECVRFTQNYFDFIKKEGKGGERGADLINRLGAEKVKQELNNNLPEDSTLKSIICETRLEEKETDKVILRIRAICGEVTSNQLRKIADIAEKYGHGFVHFVVRGSPEIPGIDKGQLEGIRKELQDVNVQILDKGIDNLQSCFGDYCTESNVNPQSLLKRIEQRVEELDLNNLNIRVSATGCPNSCGIAQLNDIGFMGIVEPEIDTAKCNGCALCLPVCKTKAIKIKDGVAVIDKEECKYCAQCVVICPFDAIIEKKKGFAVFVGGQEGEDTRLGQVIAEFLSEEEAFQVAERCLRIVKDKKANVATIIDEAGVEEFKEMLIPSTK
jgi:dissimilatory sulfite reductase (desulfoviridin) alpha/beta subunit